MKHFPQPDGTCSHVWRNRTTHAVSNCQWLAGWNEGRRERDRYRHALVQASIDLANAFRRIAAVVEGADDKTSD